VIFCGNKQHGHIISGGLKTGGRRFGNLGICVDALIGKGNDCGVEGKNEPARKTGKVISAWNPRSSIDLTIGKERT